MAIVGRLRRPFRRVLFGGFELFLLPFAMLSGVEPDRSLED